MYCLYYKVTAWARSFNILIISALGQVSGGFYYGSLCGPTFNSMGKEVEEPLSPSFISQIRKISDFCSVSFGKQFPSVLSQQISGCRWLTI